MLKVWGSLVGPLVRLPVDVGLTPTRFSRPLDNLISIVIMLFIILTVCFYYSYKLKFPAVGHLGAELLLY